MWWGQRGVLTQLHYLISQFSSLYLVKLNFSHEWNSNRVKSSSYKFIVIIIITWKVLCNLGRKRFPFHIINSYSAKTCSIGIKSYDVLMTQILYKFGPKETQKENRIMISFTINQVAAYLCETSSMSPWNIQTKSMPGISKTNNLNNTIIYK